MILSWIAQALTGCYSNIVYNGGCNGYYLRNTGQIASR